ncbi:fibrillarin [Candidatus Woesearchaeota archaeon CG10_big_fil_rev_8_21_14_0_10_34_8]|nr:MAG: fibrillarin [Candidatus Woesearchaeota archaeon CG10_big_fil_rev_8_21_14_0_10_34_8]
MIPKQIQSGIYLEQKKNRSNYYTKNLIPNQQVYDEKLVGEYRQWSIKKSKFAAALAKGVSNIKLNKGDVVLYLGASTGTTVSHISDIVEKSGMIFAVELSFRMAQKLIFLAETRPNIAPILADANHPESYHNLICEADFVFQDIAQKNQVEIFLKNLQFLKPGKQAMLCIKAKSIDITKQPKQIYSTIRDQLQKKVKIITEKRLDPLELDHCVFLVQKH